MANEQPQDLRAFQLKAEHKDISGFTVSYTQITKPGEPDLSGNTFDVKAALDAGKGTVVVDAIEQPNLAEVLLGQPALKSVTAPDSAPKSASAGKE